jgi:hypothetical protein
MLSKTPLYCVAVKILMMAVPATAQVMTRSPSPAQASPQQASPLQPTSPESTMQATSNIQLTCAYFQRNSNGSWTQQSPVTVNGQTLDIPGVRINPGTIIGGIDLGAALNRQCR